MSGIELKPCPFCGSANAHLKQDTGDDGAEVICRDCQSAGPLVPWEDCEADGEVIAEAALLWNTRSQSERERRLEEALRVLEQGYRATRMAQGMTAEEVAQLPSIRQARSALNAGAVLKDNEGCGR